jgi:hypothetical protein
MKWNGQTGKLLAAVGLLIAAVGVWYLWGREAPVLPDQIRFVCAATGKAYRLDRSRVQTFPARNPETGEETLVPVYEEDGRIKVPSRYASVLDDLGGANRYFDRNTLTFQPPQ